MPLTLAHWLYALVTLVVIITMLFRRGVVIPTLVGTFLVAWVFTGSLLTGVQAMFNASAVAARELFTIFLIITFMVALLRSLEALGADKLMLKPIQKVMVNPTVAFFVLIGATWVLSLFFWPTPALALIGTLLIPAAVGAGLPPMGAAMGAALAGQGMALSSDYVIGVAPSLSARAAGIEPGPIADRALVLSLVTGLVAIAGAFLMLRLEARRAGQVPNPQPASVPSPREGEGAAAEKTPLPMKGGALDMATPAEERTGDLSPELMRRRRAWAGIFAVLVPVALLAVAAYMVFVKVSGAGGLQGGEGAAFIGGVAVALLMLACAAFNRVHALDSVADHLAEGFVFAFRVMGPVIPVGGFFFLGNAEFAGPILGLAPDATKPAFVVDLVNAAQGAIPQNPIITAFGILGLGIISGLDGTGFDGLPLTGALAGAIGPQVGIDPATLAAIGQMGAIWTGGGTIIAWSSLVAVAGFAGVSVIDLARKNFLPVIAGLILSTLVAVIIW